MNKLWIIVRQEYLTTLRSKSFWIGTFLVPIIMLAFGGFVGYMAATSESSLMASVNNPLMPENDDMSGWQIAGMLVGILMTLFIMIYGAQIFNKVKTEKCNRIMEVMATCVAGRTMLLAKIISVGLLGMTQLFLWGLLMGIGLFFLLMTTGFSVPLTILGEPRFYLGIFYAFGFFTGGYVFYGSLFAAAGAMTDKNQENQEYMTVLTFILLASFYIGEFASTNASSAFVTICSFIPLTASSVAPVGAIGGTVPLWQSLLSLIVLWICALGTLSFSGKLYTSMLLLKGKRLSPKDLVTFMRTK